MIEEDAGFRRNDTVARHKDLQKTVVIGPSIAMQPKTYLQDGKQWTLMFGSSLRAYVIWYLLVERKAAQLDGKSSTSQV